MGAAGFSGAGGGYGGVVAGPAGGYVGGARGPAGNGVACGVGPGEECTACGVGCGAGAGGGALSYVGGGQGEYIQETTYKYVGYGGDFDVMRPRRDFTCIFTSCCLLSLLLLIPLLCWLLSGTSTSLPYNCDAGFGATTELPWSQAQKDFCCATVGRGCATVPPTVMPAPVPTVPPTPFPTPPPTPPPTQPPTRPAPRPLPPTAPPGPVDPYNCAVGVYQTWDGAKQTWCCSHHHICGQPIEPPRPADPYNCADGFANWQAGWSVAKKDWCCRVHGKGCPNQGGGCAPVSPIAPIAEPYDCEAGFANWMAGWSVAKKAWCCSNKGKGCPPAAGGCA